MKRPNVGCRAANPWVQFLSPKQHADLSMLPSRKTETSSADLQSGMEESERMAGDQPGRGKVPTLYKDCLCTIKKTVLKKKSYQKSCSEKNECSPHPDNFITFSKAFC